MQTTPANTTGLPTRAVIGVALVFATVLVPAAAAQQDYSDLVKSMKPLAYWRLGEANRAIDQMRTAHGRHNARLTSGAPVSQSDPGLEFRNKYVDIPHSRKMQVGNGSLMLWFRYDGGGNSTLQGLFSKDAVNFGAGGHLSVYLWGRNRIAARLQSVRQSHWVFTSAIVQPAQWQFLVLTWGSQGMRLYHNGKLVASRGYQGGLSGNTEPIALGADSRASRAGSIHKLGYHFRGAMDECALFPAQLTGEQVQKLYEGVLGDPHTYYVRTDGRDTNDGLSRSTAFRTIGKALNVVGPGDTVYVGGGTYREQYRGGRAGTQTEVIQFIADTKGVKTGRPGAVVVKPGGGGYALLLQNIHYTTFDGFTFSGEGLSRASNVIVTGSRGVVVKNCEFVGNRNSGLTTSSYDVTVEGCRFRQNRSYSLLAYYGKCVLRNCQFIQNGYGPYFYRQSELVADNVTVTSGSSWSAVINSQGVSNPRVVLRNVSLRDGRYGMYFNGLDFARMQLSKVQVRNHRDYGLYLQNSTYRLNPRTQKELAVSGSRYPLAATSSRLVFRGVTMKADSKAQYGCFTRYCDIVMRNTEFQGNGRNNGFYAYQPSSFRALRSSFTQHGGWSAMLYGGKNAGRFDFRDCSFTSNRNGVYVNGATGDSVAFNGMQLKDNGSYGYYFQNCDLQFTPSTLSRWNVQGSAYPLAARSSKLRFDGVTLQSDTRARYDLITWYCDLSIKGSVFRGSGKSAGVYVYRPRAFTAVGATFTNHGSWALMMDATGLPKNAALRLSNCTIEDNRHGVRVTGANQQNVTFDGMQLRNNTQYGYYLQNCDLTFDRSTIRSFDVQGSSYPLAARSSKLKLHDLTLQADARATYDLMTWYCDLDIQNSVFRGNGKNTGLYIYRPKRFRAANMALTNHGNWALMMYAHGLPKDTKLQFRDCRISDNRHGVYVDGANGQNVAFNGMTLRKNQHYGYYLRNCDLDFDAKTLQNWDVQGSYYPLAAYNSRLVFDDVTLQADSAARYGLLTYYCDLDIRKTSFLGSGKNAGLYVYRPRAFSAQDSTFANHGGWALNLYARGLPSSTKLQFKDCSIRDNGNGVYVYGGSGQSIGFDGMQLRNNAQYGLYLRDSQLAITSQTREQLDVQGSRYPLAAYRSKLAFDGVSFQFDQSAQYDLLSYYCDLTLKDTTFRGSSGGGSGLYVYRPLAFQAEGSSITNHGGWALRLYATDKAKLDFRNSTVRDNKYGVYIDGARGENVALKGITLQDNQVYGYYFRNCELEFDSENWKVKGSYYPVAAYSSKLSFEDVSFTADAATRTSFLTYYCDLTLENTSLRGNGRNTGLYMYRPKGLQADKVSLANHGGWSAQLYADNTGNAQFQFNECDFNNNYSGLYCQGVDDAKLKFTKSKVEQNEYYGLYLRNSTYSMDAADDLQINGNGYNLAGYRSTLRLSGARLANATQYSLISWYSDVDVVDSTLSSRNNGLYAYRNNSTNLIRTRLDGEGKGWGLLKYGGSLKSHNTIFGNFGSGGYLYAYTANDSSDIIHTTIGGARYYGLYVNRGKATVTNCILSGNTARYGLLQAGGGRISHSYNLVHGFRNAFHLTPAHETELLNNPRFMNAGSGDFHLASGSPAINSGADLTHLVSTDIEGNQRPSYDVCEIGAYEYMSPTGSFRVLEWNEQQ